MTGTGKLFVFVSHASEDKPIVRKLCKRLRADGFDPWLDEERILPGQDWDLEIKKALRASDAILLCFSTLSVPKEGYIQREYKKAMDYQQEMPEGAIFVIPVRLDDCEIPFTIRDLQYVGYPEDYEHLRKALNLRAEKVNAAPAAPKTKPAAKGITPKKANAVKKIGGHTYNIGSITVGGNLIQGDQTNYITNFNIESQPEFIDALTHLQAQITALKNQPGVSNAQTQTIAIVEQKLAEAVAEARQPEPLGERVKSTLSEAKEVMDMLKGSLQSAVALGTTLGGLAALAIKLFGG